MGKNFPTLEEGFKGIGVSLGLAVEKVGTFVNSTKGMSNFKSLFSTSSYVVEGFGSALAYAIEAFTDILRIAAPMTKAFVDFLVSKAKAFRDFVQTKEATGEIQHFFQRAQVLAGKFGQIFGNIFKGLGKIIGANFEEGSGGDMMLDWLITATDKFANLDKTVGGAGALNEYFKDAVTNSKAILQSIGALIRELMALGTMPEIKQFWDTLATGAPAVGEIFREGIKASPILAQIIVDLTNIVAVLADSTAIKVFFTILQKVTGALSALFNNETVRTIVDATAAVAAVGLAFGFITSKAALLYKVMVGVFIKLTGASTAFARIWAGPIFLAIALIIGAFANLYKNNEAFKTQVDGFIAAFQGLFSGISASAATLGPQLEKFFQVFSESLMPIFVLLMNTIMDLFPYIMQLADIFFKDLLPVILDVAGILMQSLLPALSSILGAILPLIPIIINSLMPVVVLLAEAFGMLAPQLATVVSQIVGALVPVIISLMGVLVPIIQLVVELVSSFAQMLIPIIMTVVEIFMVLLPIITAIITVVADLAAVFLTVLGPILNVIVQVLTFLARLITGVVVAAFRFLAGVVALVFSGISIAVKGMQDGFKWAMNQMISFAEGFVNFFVDGLNWIISLLNKLKIDIPEVLRPLVGGMKSIGFNIQPLQKVRLPRLADGGTVYPSAGGSIVNVAEAGRPERIEPLDPNGLSARDKALIQELSGGGMQITVNAAPGMDERELAEAVSRRLAFEMRKGTI
jgi:phage-related protein